jgi:NAD(P)-dependent dehydrogenase (short-subunit alcohol dehydrogenase family)
VPDTTRILGGDLPESRKKLFSREGWKKWVPAGRQGRVDEVADLVLFLVAGNGGYITG